MKKKIRKKVKVERKIKPMVQALTGKTGGSE